MLQALRALKFNNYKMRLLKYLMTFFSLLSSSLLLFSQEVTFHAAFTFRQEFIWMALIVNILVSYPAKSGIDYIGDIFSP